VSTTAVPPSKSSRIPGRNRLLRGSSEVHTAQAHPTIGTPVEVPDPVTVTLRSTGEGVYPGAGVAAICAPG
jgi:hypothetical protein